MNSVSFDGMFIFRVLDAGCLHARSGATREASSELTAGTEIYWLSQHCFGPGVIGLAAAVMSSFCKDKSEARNREKWESTA